ncbi:MAG: NADH-quinone oxidoreductase subunit I [Syntrophales bacterium]|jgi:NADH-quinone oxidoreductase chain I|nr:NADH-quinone oxidoreductase subunit I [Syntrophales bacterium]MCK9527234.1 NADH-quinone oxidoreductase subunit I [Syntrophales bacterium]MDX9921296.1 NADH-quinone oxidoreductase subunit I [Syntrophales bacterium]
MIKALLNGLWTTLKEFFRKPITMQYPEQKWTFPERFRGRPKLLTDDTGGVLCVACGLCEKICPCQCIIVVPGTGPDGIRNLKDYTLDLSRCCFCGMCVESCPVEAIIMGHEYELAVYDRKQLILDTAELTKKSLR